MKLFLLFLTITSVSIGCSKNFPHISAEAQSARVENTMLKESSMNFDSENIIPFLKRLKPLIEAGFSDNEILQIQKMLENLKVDEEKELEFPIQYQGEKSILRIKIFMDDIDAPDVYIFTHPKLANEIDKEMDRFMDELDI